MVQLGTQVRKVWDAKLATLSRVPPVPAGYDQLIDAIKAGGQVLCPCSVGRDYHIGAWDAERILAEHVPEYLQKVPVMHGRPLTYYRSCPLSGPELERSLAALAEMHREAGRALSLAYGDSYDPQKGLLEDSAKQTFREAFSRLRRYGYLPITVGNSRFTHDSMVLMIAECFMSEGDLVAYLRSPETLLPGA